MLIQAPSSDSNSVHLGLDGEPTTYGGIGLDVPAGDWTWTNEVQGRPQRVTIDVATAGDHTVNLWIREDGVRVDRILLTQDADFVPSETGPSATTTDPFATELVSNQISVMSKPPRPGSSPLIATTTESTNTIKLAIQSVISTEYRPLPLAALPPTQTVRLSGF